MSFRRPQRVWKEEEIKSIVSFWKDFTPSEIARKLGMRNEQVNYLVTEMRKIGFDLPKKKQKGRLQAILLKVKSEM